MVSLVVYLAQSSTGPSLRCCCCESLSGLDWKQVWTTVCVHPLTVPPLAVAINQNWPSLQRQNQEQERVQCDLSLHSVCPCKAPSVRVCESERVKLRAKSCEKVRVFPVSTREPKDKGCQCQDQICFVSVSVCVFVFGSIFIYTTTKHPLLRVVLLIISQLASHPL